MARPSLSLRVEAHPHRPLFQQVALALSESIRQGALRPGDRLPGSRSLAESLGCHRNTVLAAYDELQAEGWLRTRPGGGTYVSEAIPGPARAEGLPPALAGDDAKPRPAFPWSPRARPYASPSFPPGSVVFANGTPDPRLMPAEALGRAYRRVLLRHGGRLLDYEDPQGHPRLREALSRLLAERRALACPPEAILCTRGSQQALFLCAQALVRPGDRVAVEAVGYRPAWEAFRLAGAELLPVPVDGEGLDVGALARLLAHGPLRAVYLTPHHQYPTTVTLSAGRRLRLLALAKAHGLAIVEDDYDHEFHHEARPVLPLASADPGGLVLHVGTFSKIVAPSLRFGFVAGPQAFVAELTRLRTFVDRQGDPVMELALAQLLEDGELQRHAARMRRVVVQRRDRLVALLEERLGEALAFQRPAGGMALWATARQPVDWAAWEAAALARGVGVYPADRCRFEGLPPDQGWGWRLGFAALNEAELEVGTARLAEAWRSLPPPG